MRTTIVPAQITTIEDRIAGSLGLSQVLLLVTPVFIGSGLYIALPPFFGYAIYKVGVIVLLALICSGLAVRIKGKLVLEWATVLLSYNRRPSYYVFNKNSMHNRQADTTAAPMTAVDQTVPDYVPRAHVSPVANIDLLDTNDRSAQVRFITTKKGELRVLLTEVPRESISTPAN